jgi:hypothetical protein
MVGGGGYDSSNGDNGHSCGGDGNDQVVTMTIAGSSMVVVMKNLRLVFNVVWS